MERDPSLRPAPAKQRRKRKSGGLGSEWHVILCLGETDESL